MKKILLAFALLGLGAACKSTADVHDTTCTDPNCAECMTKCDSECTPEMKAECQAKCEAEGNTCPVTGKSVN